MKNRYSHILKFVLFNLSFICFTNLIVAQSTLSEIQDLECDQFASKAATLVANNLQKNNLSEASVIIENWRVKCGETEPLFRAEIILRALKNKTKILGQQDSIESISYRLMQYKNRLDFAKGNEFYTGYYSNKSYFGFLPVRHRFDTVSTRLANQLKSNYSIKTEDYFLLNYYGGQVDSIYKQSQLIEDNSSLVKQSFKRIANRAVNTTGVRANFKSGIWLPQGDMKFMGAKINLGAAFAFTRKKWELDFEFGVRFLKSQQAYMAKRNDFTTFELTNHYLGFLAGTGVYYEVLTSNNKKHNFLFSGGVALDGFDAIKENIEQNLPSGTAYSYNFNFGFEYRLALNKETYISIHPRYHIVDYTISNTVNFTANPISIDMNIGIKNNVDRDNQMRYLY